MFVGLCDCIQQMFLVTPCFLRLIFQLIHVDQLNVNFRQVGAGIHILYQAAADLNGHSGCGRDDALLVIDTVMFLDRY